jgi:DNA polymerase I-like protein with 3'-5' exonuclease and polymerase domains
MVRIHDLLKGRKSSMLVQIHDEILLEVHGSERLLVPKIKEIMENVYLSKNNLRLTCGVEHSNVSFASIDKVKGLPIV